MMKPGAAARTHQTLTTGFVLQHCWAACNRGSQEEVFKHMRRQLLHEEGHRGLSAPAMAKGKRQPQGEMSLAPRLMHPATSMPTGGSIAMMGC